MPTLNLGRVGFVNKGAYVGGTTAYKINDIVVYNNTVYACIQAHNTSHLPTDTAYWQKWTGYGASGIVNTPSGGIAATDVQSAINELDTEKQNIAPSYQGTKSVDLASASTVNIGAATGDYIHITGTTTITAFDTAVAGLKRTLVFDASLTLTHNATSLILPAGTNITTTAKDVAVFISEGSGNWRCVSYQFSSGSYALLGNNQTFTGTNTFSVSPVLPTPTVGDNSTKGATTAFVQGEKAGSVIQVANYTTGTVATGTTTVPLDNTVPQITEGTQFMSLVFTPKKNNSKLVITVVAECNPSVSTAAVIALFDGSTNAIASMLKQDANATFPNGTSFNAYYTVSSTSPITFTVRIGGTSASTITFNGFGGAQYMGGSLASSITIMEIAQ